MEYEVFITLLVILLIATFLLLVTSLLTSIKGSDRKPAPGLVMFFTVGAVLTIALLIR